MPLSAKRITHDPFADKHSARWVWGVVAVLVLATLAWRCGWLDRVLPQPWQYEAVMAEVAPPPAATSAPAPSPAP